MNCSNSSGNYHSKSSQSGLLKVYQQNSTNRGYSAWIITFVLSAFYIDLYFFDHLESPAQALGLKNKWFLYGLLYSLAFIVGGYFMLKRHGNNRYQYYRTMVNIAVQVVFGFTLPYVMKLFLNKEHYFSYFWPLKIDYFYPSFIEQNNLPLILYSFIGSLVIFPLLAILLGKRFYCSWVCGCGGLANTFGDQWRHLSDKSSRAWKFEKFSVHGVMILAIVTTGLVLYNWTLPEGKYPTFSHYTFKLQDLYGFWIGAVWSGLIGVGLYPLMGTRVWCRFGCPMAAILGLLQKAGRFQITVKNDMCISCGNCSTYCEMGIDVRAYAQRNESFTRASCVGCGMCAHMCPRGVLKLENKAFSQKN